MHFQFAVAPPTPGGPLILQESPKPEGAVELLRKILEVQSEQLRLMRIAQANNDHLARWRTLLGRWQGDFPQMGKQCREIVPHLEKTYLRLIQELSDQLHDEDSEGIENDFSLNEFLDRYGVRLSQLGTILSLIGTLADAGNTEPA